MAGTDNRTESELSAHPDPRYSISLRLNGTPFYFRSEGARDDFAATFRDMEGMIVEIVE